MAKEMTTELTFWETELETIRSVGPWQTETEVIRDALDALLSSRAELRQAVAVKLYLQDKVTLSRAAEIAGMNIWQFRDHLRARGIAIVVPEEKSEDLDAMIASFRRVVERWPGIESQGQDHDGANDQGRGYRLQNHKGSFR